MRATPGRSYPNHARRLFARRMHFVCAGRVEKGSSRYSGIVLRGGKVAADQGFDSGRSFRVRISHDMSVHLVMRKCYFSVSSSEFSVFIFALQIGYPIRRVRCAWLGDAPLLVPSDYHFLGLPIVVELQKSLWHMATAVASHRGELPTTISGAARATMMMMRSRMSLNLRCSRRRRNREEGGTPRGRKRKNDRG